MRFTALTRKEILFISVVLLVALIIRSIVMVRLGPMLDEAMLIQEIQTMNWHMLPVHFVGFGWGENILLGVIAWPFIQLFHGAELLSIRGIVLAGNLISMIFLYTLAARLFNKNTAKVTLVFAALWPWNILAGSIGFNVFLLLPLLFGAILLIFSYLDSDKPGALYIAAVLLALSCYAYVLSFFWIAVVIAMFGILYRKKIRPHHAGIFIALLAIISIPVFIFHLQTQLGIRVIDHFLFFIYPQLTATRYEGIGITNLYHGVSLLMHYALNYGLHFVYILLAFNPLYFLLQNSLVAGFAHSGIGFLFDSKFYALAPTQGLYLSSLAYVWDAVFVSIGLAALIRKKDSTPYRRFILIWILAAPVAPSLVNGDYLGFTATRDIMLLPLLLILSAYGYTVCAKNLAEGSARVRKQKKLV